MHGHRQRIATAVMTAAVVAASTLVDGVVAPPAASAQIVGDQTAPDAPVSPQSEVADVPPTTAPPPPPDRRDRSGKITGTAPALDVVPVYSVTYAGLAARLADKLGELGEQQTLIGDTQRLVGGAAITRASLEGLIGRSLQRQAKLAVERERYDAELGRFARKAYTTDRFGEMLSTLHETTDEGLYRSHAATMLQETTKIIVDRSSYVDERLENLETVSAAWGEQLFSATTLIEDGENTIAAAQQEADRLQVEAERLREGMDKERPMSIVDNSDLPFRALDAYWRAAHAIAMTDARCGLQWWMLAGIGRTESNHGRMAGAQPTPDGTLTVPIIGIPLDGTNNTRAIPDTDGGVLDGDIEWDRAVGPMQFIPSTWARWGADGSGDRVANPHNIYDAALSSGRLLCSGPPLTTLGGIREAFLRYNRSSAYVDIVLERGLTYALLPVPQGMVPAPTDPAVIAAIGARPVEDVLMEPEAGN